MRRCPAKIAILAYLFLAFINMRAGAQAQWPVHPWESKPALPLVEMEEPPLQAMSTPNVPVFGQRDGRWSGIHLGGSGWTMYDSGCAVTSVAMVFKYFGGDVDPGALCNWLNGNGGLDGGGNINWARAADSQGGRSWWIERKDWNYVLGSGELDYLRTQVDRGYPPIVEVRLSGSRHFVVITGYKGWRVLQHPSLVRA